MRHFTLDNKKIPAPNAQYLGFHNKLAAKRGHGILCRVWKDGPISLARVLGRIASCDSDGEDCRGFACVLMLSDDAHAVYTRWIDPKHIIAIFDMPSRIPAFFFSQVWDKPLSAILHAERQGSLHELYIDKLESHVALEQQPAASAAAPMALG